MMALGQRLQPLAFLFDAHPLNHWHDSLEHRIAHLTGIDQMHYHSLGVTGKLFRNLKSGLPCHAQRIALNLAKFFLLIEHIHFQLKTGDFTAFSFPWINIQQKGQTGKSDSVFG